MWGKKTSCLTLIIVIFQHSSHTSPTTHSVPIKRASRISVPGNRGFRVVEQPSTLLRRDLSMRGNNDGFAGERFLNYCPKAFRLTVKHIINK